MSFNQFCKEVLTPVLTGVYIGYAFCLFVEGLQKIRTRELLRKKLRKLQEALEKAIEEMKIMEITQTLEAFGKEIKASENEKLLWLHAALEKANEEEKEMEFTQTLEALEKEIKASQNEKLLRIHESLVKNIKALN